MNKVVFCYSQLKTKLTDGGVTQSNLAGYIGISEQILAKILDDGLPFRIKDIKAICEVLHIPHADIDRYFFNEKFD